MNVQRTWVLAAILLIFAGPVLAQERHSVEGTVTDASDGTTLPGVNVQVKGTTIGTATDNAGHYELQVPSPTDTLVVSFVGYERQEIPINGRSTIDVALQSVVLTGEELIVTGYQTQRRADITGAVSSVETADLQQEPATNPIKSLQGKVAGLNVQTTGSPTGDATVRIRGVNTLGNNAPLYIIDGIPTKTGVEQQLAPGDIESIQVLKDAAASSIYGARASNGVIIIETKSGGAETLEVNFSADVSRSSWPDGRIYDVLDTRGKGVALWRAAINDGIDPATLPIYEYDWERRDDGTAVLNEVMLPEFLGVPENQTKPAVPGTDWAELISETGLIQSYNMSAQFGGENGGAYMGLRFHDNEGIIKENDFQRISARINSDYTFFDGRFRVSENLTLAKETEGPLPSSTFGGGPFFLAMRQLAVLPVRTEDGEFAGPIGAGFSDRDNPVRLLEANRNDENNTGHIFGNIQGDLDILENLTLTGRFGVDWERVQARNIQRSFRAGFLSRTINSLENFDLDEFTWTFNSTLNYDFILGSNHTFNVLGGMEAVAKDIRTNTTFREDFAVQDANFFVEGAGSGRSTVDGSRTGFKLLSYFQRLDYNFADRYLASFTFRIDGSSRFGTNNQFGTFPAFSLGWRVTEEPFMSDRFDRLSDLKLRFSWGKTGNQEIADFASFGLFEPRFSSLFGDTGLGRYEAGNGTAYDIDGVDSGSIPGGFRRLQLANSDLRWEETTEFNVGFDFGLLDQKLTGGFDYFSRETEDILIQPPFIAVAGEGANQFINGATVETTGFEVQLGYQDDVGDIGFRVSGNVGSSSDEITKLPPDVVDAFPGNAEQTILGHSQFSHFGFVADGLFRSQEEVDAHAEQPGKAIGRIRFRDLNGDGVITTLDQKFLGDSNPDFEYGLTTNVSYKGVDVSLFWQGVHGREVNVLTGDGFKCFTDFVSCFSGENNGTRTLDAFFPGGGLNMDSDIPALTLSDQNNETTRVSTYGIEDGSYLKLRDVTVGYRLPSRFAGQMYARDVRIWVRGENLLTFETGSGDFTGPDPETENFTFPRPRTWTVGVNLGF